MTVSMYPCMAAARAAGTAYAARARAARRLRGAGRAPFSTSPRGRRRYNAAMSTPVLKHNSYFDGQVQSIGYTRHGRAATVGVIAPGQFHYGTNGPERMTVLSGELGVKRDGATERLNYPAGTAFEVAGKSGFAVRASAPSAYLCEFI